MGVPTAHGDLEGDSENEGPVETDPSNRYQRCDEILGEGAYKLVYKACDLEEGNEVAWNQLRFDHLSKREALKILSEIKILQSIRNEHIINFYASWSTPTSNGGERIVFITELMSSGTLKQYLRKTLKGVPKPKVAKSWCRQILQGLAYLHTHDPPIIHRDLKCDNIFINGNNGQLKIGDLGLAVVRHRTHVSSVLGTPEFMAPELYDEKYNEKVDIYAFGMCVLEMVTKDYPYAECTNQAQIYRKVTQGIKPQALDHIQDPEIKGFITHCLDHDASTRPSAHELLALDFLKPCIPYHIPTEAGQGRAPSRVYPHGTRYR
ncbi:kinase-like domain-containing protein [Gamsiella multidivaricata]|uniref:kinase-like domain-containing protein n=1 Tax=Gamsiella multidivaricata TaxID=101098 RepID=UPI00221F9529|nr:kinase-like domain-containing protein [Gamsiella multidivaricata]KAI7817338.1 kinase-like domain-containing protein [Gamsiella multidivaricata]